MTEQITPRQTALAIFTGMSAPLALAAGAMPWPSVLLGLAAGGVLVHLLPPVDGEPTAFLRSGYLLWALLMMAKTAELSRSCFQEATDYVPMVLLALAAASTRRGASVSGRLGAILWPLIAALLGGLLLCAAQDFRWTRFAVSHGDSRGWTTAAALALSPTVLRVLPASSSRGLRSGWRAGAVLGMAASVICCGVLGRLRPQMDQPLYQMLRGVSILGVTERLEALLSAMLCVGCFMALSLLCAASVESIKPYLTERAERWSSTGIAAAALALYRPVSELPASAWTGFAIVFGAFLSLAEKLWKKKVKVREKTLDKRGRAW